MIQKTDFIEKINAYLNSCIPQSDNIQDGLAQSMRYSLLAGGKRIRPLLVMEFAAALGENPDKVLPVACAVEMIHTYSLIHDDLPCMDNDVLRRGKPTNHVVYGECTATLAGDALQPLAFETLLSSELPAERAVRCTRILAECIGMKGMCLGQYLDMLGEGKVLTSDELNLINNNKTGALLAASCGIGTAVAGGSERQINAAMNFGYKIGLAFQIRDDILDVISTSEELGKNVGSDAEEKKNTYMVLLGREKCENEIKRLTEEAISVLEEEFSGFDISAPVELARSMENRKN